MTNTQRLNLVEKLILRMIESNRFDSKASRELSMSEDVEELRRDVGEKE
jgi:hypothetical protein